MDDNKHATNSRKLDIMDKSHIIFVLLNNFPIFKFKEGKQGHLVKLQNIF